VIYDARGNLWRQPNTIGFHRNEQRDEWEPADSITFSQPKAEPPGWVEEERSSAPYAGRRTRAPR
jgi:hypothetical protein